MIYIILLVESRGWNSAPGTIRRSWIGDVISVSLETL